MSALADMQAQLRQNVAHGAAFLDERTPGWPEKVDLAQLSMTNPRLCILGQIFGDFFNSATLFCYESQNIRWASEHGFIVYTENILEELRRSCADMSQLLRDCNTVLKEAWINEINIRREPK